MSRHGSSFQPPHHTPTFADKAKKTTILNTRVNLLYDIWTKKKPDI